MGKFDHFITIGMAKRDIKNGEIIYKTDIESVSSCHPSDGPSHSSSAFKFSVRFNNKFKKRKGYSEIG